jgi:hypothetical protein
VTGIVAIVGIATDGVASIVRIGRATARGAIVMPVPVAKLHETAIASATRAAMQIAIRIAMHIGIVLAAKAVAASSAAPKAARAMVTATVAIGHAGSVMGIAKVSGKAAAKAVVRVDVKAAAKVGVSVRCAVRGINLPDVANRVRRVSRIRRRQRPMSQRPVDHPVVMSPRREAM